jgi:hypothetical protein
LVIIEETSHGEKKKKNRLTVPHFCSTEGSEKLQPLVMGKFEKACYMKNKRIVR